MGQTIGKRLGKLEYQFFAYVQMMETQTVRIGEFGPELGLSSEQEQKLLSRLTKSGMIARVQRGLYLFPKRLPLGGKWTPDPIFALTELMKEHQGRYQICGLNTFNRYGFSEQMPNRTYAYNNRISGMKTIGAVTLMLIKVADKRLGDTEEVKAWDGTPGIYSSRTRTLVDAVYDWARFNTLPRAYRWIRGELRENRVKAADLVDCTLKYGDVGARRRMGTLLEMLDVDDVLLQKLEQSLKPSTAFIPWVPRKPKRGTISRRWGVVINGKT